MFGRNKDRWPAGIPKYEESDIMQEQDLLNFAMGVIQQSVLDETGYEILAATDKLGVIPNFVCKKDGETIFIVVKADVAPSMPRMSVEEKKHLLEHAAKLGIKTCYFAPVGIGACDPDRFAASLALKDDAFYIKFQGLEPVEFKKSMDWIQNALEEIKELDPSTQYLNESPVKYSINVTTEDLDGFGKWKERVKTETFQEMLMKCIEIKGLSSQEFYTAAWLDRKLFSAIKNNPDYQPKKETAVACCLGLGLGWPDAEKLLELAGYKLSLSIAWDRVIYYCIRHGITDIDVVNEILYEENEKCIRV